MFVTVISSLVAPSSCFFLLSVVPCLFRHLAAVPQVFACRSVFDVCLNWLSNVFCWWVHILSQVVLHGNTFGSCCGSQFAYQMSVSKVNDDI